jgi:transposase
LIIRQDITLKTLTLLLFYRIIKETAVSKMGRPKKYIVNLSDEQLKSLKSTIRKKKTSRTLRCRCQVLIDIDECHGKIMTYEQSAKSNGICLATVNNIAKDYYVGGIEKVMSYNRSVNSDQARRKLDGRSEAKIIEIACGPAPDGRARWTLRLLEEKCRVELETPVSKDAIGRALKKTNFDLTATTTGASRQRKTRNS